MNQLAGGRYVAESAGLEAGILNPFVVRAMAEEGIDISENKTNYVFDYFKEGRIYHYVFRVCDEAAAERCPVFPDILECIHWDIADPSSFEGTDLEKMEFTRKIRDQIKEHIVNWLKEN